MGESPLAPHTKNGPVEAPLVSPPRKETRAGAKRKFFLFLQPRKMYIIVFVNPSHSLIHLQESLHRS